MNESSQPDPVTIEIKGRWSGRVLFSHTQENNTLRAAVLEADLSGADLRGADLREANLSGANLREANLRGADLSGADLREANLREANLRGANLSGANLRGADLRGADLSGANLSEADLSEANLRGANLRGADLSGANLSGANLSGANLSEADLRGVDLRETKNDFYEILLNAPGEIAGLRQAIIEGRVEGSTYTGECACLVGTIANVRGASVYELPGIPTNSSRPSERWFLGINKGATPENSPIAKITVEWIDEYANKIDRHFPAVTPA